MKIVHIIPDRTIADGVGNYGTILSNALNSYSGVASEVIAYRWRKSTDSLLSVISPERQILVLHWSPYGYSHRGIPFGMVREIEELLAQHPSTRLIVMFHELFAIGVPWNSSFWLSSLQKSLARRLLRRSDCAVTTTERYEAILRAWCPNASVKCLSVFSTIGEPVSVPSSASRSNTGVIFGRAGVDDWIYRKMRSGLADFTEQHDLQAIVDVGPRRGEVPKRIKSVAVEQVGVQPAETVSRILSQARFGFLAYPRDLLDKSTTFAAYAAHGVLPVILWPEEHDHPADLNRFGLLQRAVNSHNPIEWDSAQAQLRAWYCRHSVRNQAKLWRNWVSALVQSGSRQQGRSA